MFLILMYTLDDLSEKTAEWKMTLDCLRIQADGRKDHWVERLGWVLGRTRLGVHDCCR